jgi:adenylate cyclase
LRVKITIPYLLLALIFTSAVAFVVSRVILESTEERFTNELIAAGKLSNEWVVAEEDRLLKTLRLLANTDGVANAIVLRNAERLRELTFNLIFIAQEESVEILNFEGESVLSMRLKDSSEGIEYEFSRGGQGFAEWGFVQAVLQEQVDDRGDKFVGLVRAPWGDFFYVVGPVFGDDNSLVGAILVGKSLPTMVDQIRQATLAHVNIYTTDGELVTSTLLNEEGEIALTRLQAELVVLRQESESLVRELSLGGVDYREILSPWVARGHLNLGLIGTSLAETVLVRTSQVTLVEIFLLVLFGFALVIATGMFVANRITHPLLRIVYASTEVASGNLEAKVELGGNDEIAVLAHSFNAMVSELREGSVYRDLLGRTVSPEVREQLRESLATGQLYLAGQEAEATVLVSDIRKFTPLTENESPTTVMDWLNEYFGELVPVIDTFGGVVNTFEGDSLLAFFGILPQPMSLEMSAYQASLATLEMLKVVERLNALRQERGEPPLMTGIAVTSGKVTAGSLGTPDRLHYTVIGDTVNTAHRLQAVTRRFGESGAILSRYTYVALGERRNGFKLERLGSHSLRGKSKRITVYRLYPGLNRERAGEVGNGQHG